MRYAIIEKLNKVIEERIDSEVKALYLVVQCRKLLEIVDSQRRVNYPTLSLIADWVVHSQLTGADAIQKLQEYGNFFAQQESGGMFEFMHSGFTLFPDLKSDMKRAFEQHNINTQLTNNREEWLAFVWQLIQILIDLPLQVREIPSSEDSIVTKFTFSNGFIVEDHNGVSFSISFSNGANKHFSLDLELLDK